MKVNVVCGDTGWVYDQFINYFEKYSVNTILRNSKDDKYDVAHYLPYYEVPKKPSKPCTAWMSHQEKRPDLHNKFIEAAKVVDVAISQSKKYASILRDNHNLDNVMSLITGIDLSKFKLRTKKDIDITTDKLIVGHIGRQYTSSDRKNPSLLKNIGNLDFVELRATEGKLGLNQIPKFYKGLHVVISPATIEGGPMAVQEALAVGVPIICMDGVGVANEFNKGVILANNNDTFLQILKDMYATKSHLTYWTQPKIMQEMRKQVEPQTWEKFVKEHDSIWKMITSESWKRS